MAEIKTREKSKGFKALDKAVVAGERMKRAFVRSKDQAENLLDDGQISPSEYAEDKVRYMAEDTAREVGHEAGKLTGKAKVPADLIGKPNALPMLRSKIGPASVMPGARPSRLPRPGSAP